MKRKFWIFLVLDAAWLALIWTRSLQPAAESRAESGSLLVLVQQLLPFMTMHLLRKLAHFTEFAVLGALLSLTVLQTRRKNAALALLLALAAAVCDESIQLFIPGRSGQVSDLWIDFSGAALAAAAVFLTAYLLRKRKRRAVHPGADEPTETQP